MLSGCAMFGGGQGGGITPALIARMDQPGASLDRAEAVALINQYRATVEAAPLGEDPGLDAAAQSLAAQYAASGKPPARPADASLMRLSAGYSTFADTFSGWRNSPPDAGVLADAGARRVGIAAVYNANSSYGVYWVLLLAP
jgi:uncharacterized protein YkwD